MRRVAVASVGCINVGEDWEKSLKDLAVESALNALDLADLSRVDALYVGNASSAVIQHQQNLGALFADSLNMEGAPALSFEASDASSGIAFHEAVKAVETGRIESVLVTGVEKITDASPSEAVKVLMGCEEQEYVAFTGITSPGLHAIVKRLYMDKFNAKPEEIAAFALNGHENAVNNPYANFRNRLTLKDILRSPLIADPVKLMEFTRIADGSASLVVCSLEKAKQLTDIPIEVSASAIATNKVSLTEREDQLSFIVLIKTN